MGINGSKPIESDNEYGSKTFKSFKRYKQYKQKIEEKDVNIPEDSYIEQKYFNCLYCSKVNMIEDIINEQSENRTMRARYQTWKKFKDISNDIGGGLENCLNYLISLHESKKSRTIKSTADRMYLYGKRPDSDDYDVPIAGFGKQYGDKDKHKKIKKKQQQQQQQQEQHD